MGQPPKDTSRRRFLSMAGTAATSATLYQVMTGAAPATAATPRRLSRPDAQPGTGKTVAILGAGPGGLAAAIKLGEAGYQVTVLEAKDRVGGRTMTARPGDEITEIWDDGSTRVQTCKFDPNLYLNLGAGRIPYIHQRVLDLCHKLRVPLEPYIHTTTANLYQTGKAWRGIPKPNRRIANDTRGYVAERLAKVVQKGSQADDGLGPVERRQFVDLLIEFGKLEKTDLSYTGSTRSGLMRPPTVQEPEQAVDPLLLPDLLTSEFWKHGFYQDVDLHWQTTSFQPVGGMDNIWRLAASALPTGTITFEAPVSSIRLDGNGVVVGWTKGGTPQTQRFDFCLSNIPLTVLRTQVTLTGFTPDFLTAVGNAPFAPSCKVGWQANRRFWESSRYQIYGGISRIDDEITQIWYPSNDYFSPTDKGTMTGAYCSYDNAIRLGNRDFGERLRVARTAGTRLHDEFANDAIIPENRGLSIAWHKIQYQLGAWADWSPGNAAHKGWYETLIYPQGQDNFFVLGDQVSALPGWQEGAMMSAEWVFDWIANGRRAVARSVQRVPDARELTVGAE